jgi:hypothetical protein
MGVVRPRDNYWIARDSVSVQTRVLKTLDGWQKIDTESSSVDTTIWHRLRENAEASAWDRAE